MSNYFHSIGIFESAISKLLDQGPIENCFPSGFSAEFSVAVAVLFSAVTILRQKSFFYICKWQRNWYWSALTGVTLLTTPVTGVMGWGFKWEPCPCTVTNIKWIKTNIIIIMYVVQIPQCSGQFTFTNNSKENLGLDYWEISKNLELVLHQHVVPTKG